MSLCEWEVENVDQESQDVETMGGSSSDDRRLFGRGWVNGSSSGWKLLGGSSTSGHRLGPGRLQGQGPLFEPPSGFKGQGGLGSKWWTSGVHVLVHRLESLLLFLLGRLPAELFGQIGNRWCLAPLGALVARAPLLEAHDVTVSYGPVKPLSGLSFAFAADDYPVAVTGPSGSGKTTLLRVLGGQQAASLGEVTIDGEPVRRRTWARGADSRVGFIYQDYRLVPFLTVGENLRLACELRIRAGLTQRDLERHLEAVSLGHDLLTRMPETLSGGEQQRVAIARTLLAGCSVLLADEPTGALDESNTTAVAELLNDLGRHHGVAVVIATHDPRVSLGAATTLRLSDGSLCQPD